MPIKVEKIYNGVLSSVNIADSGQLSVDVFNDFLERVQINLIRFLTGDLIDNKLFPMPYEKQKVKDYLKSFITKKIANNAFDLPADYYQWDNLYKLGRVINDADCETEEVDIDSCDKEIEILDGQKFKKRCSSWIRSRRPSNGKPIAKIIDNRVETEPKDIGTMMLEYIRYPKEAKLVMIRDLSTGDQIVDVDASGSVEWDKWALEYLIWGIKDLFSERIRESALKQFSNANKPQG